MVICVCPMDMMCEKIKNNLFFFLNDNRDGNKMISMFANQNLINEKTEQNNQTCLRKIKDELWHFGV